MIVEDILNFIGRNFLGLIVIGGLVYGGFKLYEWRKNKSLNKGVALYDSKVNAIDVQNRSLDANGYVDMTSDENRSF